MSSYSEYKKAKRVNKNVVAKINLHEYENVFFLLNKKCLRHSMNKLLGKNQRRRTYEINKMYWSCFDDKTFILDKAKKIVYLRLLDRP